jgi:hypothetical protein
VRSAPVLPGHLLGRATAAEHGGEGLTDRGDPVEVVWTEVLARCLQRQTDDVDGVLSIDRMGTATRKLAMREIRRSEGMQREDEPESKGRPRTLTPGAGDRAPAYIASEAAWNWAEAWILARNDSFKPRRAASLRD